MTDLVSGRYGAYDPMWLGFGKPNNVTQASQPMRSNAWVTGLSTQVSGLPGGANGEAYFVAVPVQEGDVITKVGMLVTVEGKTTPFCFGAVYEGTIEGKASKLIAQSTVSATNGEEVQKVGYHSYELSKAVLITSENAPYGFVYAGINCEETTVAKVATIGVPTACQVEWWKGAPKVLSMNVAQKAKSEAAASFKPETAAAVLPLIFLS